MLHGLGEDWIRFPQCGRHERGVGGDGIVDGVAGFLGYYADQWLGTLPWLFILFLCFGMAAGVMTMMRTMKMVKLNDQESDHT